MDAKLSITFKVLLHDHGGCGSRCPSRFGPPSKWTPRSKSASEYGPGSPYPLANMDLWGSLFASGFGLQFGPLTYFIIATYYILNIVLKAF